MTIGGIRAQLAVFNR